MARPKRDELITPQAAADLLQVVSIAMVLRWVGDGLIEGHRMKGCLLLSRGSVERLQGSALVQQQKAYEREREAALEPFEIDPRSPEERDMVAALTGGAHEGRKPWETRADTVA